MSATRRIFVVLAALIALLVAPQARAETPKQVKTAATYLNHLIQDSTRLSKGQPPFLKMVAVKGKCKMVADRLRYVAKQDAKRRVALRALAKRCMKVRGTIKLKKGKMSQSQWAAVAAKATEIRKALVRLYKK